MDLPFLALLGLFGSIACTGFFIRVMRSTGSGQPIREYGPKIHEHKRGTPTMGGVPILLVFLLVLLANLVVLRIPLSTEASLLIGATFCFGLIGLVDDLLKLLQQSSKGLLVRYKIIFQLLTAAGFLLIYFASGAVSTSLVIPFMNGELQVSPLLFSIIAGFTFLGIVNAMNLTDGLDGLASGVTLIILTAYGVILFATGLHGELFNVVLLFSAILVGFFIFNVFPAKIFLGDTGSMAMGGFIAALGILTHTELLLLLFAIIPVVETLSIILQLTAFRLFKTRIFKVSPLHHHFERAEGVDYAFLLPNIEWPETRITSVFWGVSALFATTGVLLYLFF
ncbi:phospho-N-acetylmuramoyl-pentapeptide-transferase [Candidatus Acetothermia bacterium]|nr:phospho-N-acetylmuramoyl-pentapeptide-transferase [Candidatus Acetothermia bacterium]MBI3643042.1 phospho-N-acetylmuramoyl-pentapeptide-transferase [Candidatus Acetothermia bacterium]